MGDFYCDEKCVVSMFLGEFGWGLQKFQGFMRFVQQKVYPNRKFLIFTDAVFYPILSDFVSYTIGLPDWFYKEDLERDCYESVLPGSPPGSLTPPHIYSRLIKDMRKSYNKDKAIELFMPRGYSDWVEGSPQSFCKLTSSLELVDFDKEVIAVFPRHRARASDRNVPTYVWDEVIDKLKDKFIIALIGTPSTTYVPKIKHENIIDFVNNSSIDALDKSIAVLNKSVMSISSQSGGTHMSVLSGVPSYIIGHDEYRHTKLENRLNTPTCFRHVIDYRAIDAETILRDINEFYNKLSQRPTNIVSGYSGKYLDIIEKDSTILRELMNE